MRIEPAGIDVVDSIINCEWRIGVLERVIDRLISVAPPNTITPQVLDQIRDQVLGDLQKKYPGAGLKKK